MKSARPFAMAPFPDDYPGDTIWFTLRFAKPVVGIPKGITGDFIWSGGERTEWVDSALLQIGDRLLEGPIVARVEMAGQPCWKLEGSLRSFHYLPIASLTGERVERFVSTDARVGQLEWEGELDAFDPAQLDRVLRKIHAANPLVAVLFQEGQWYAGEPLVDLDDAALLARLAQPPA